MIPLDQAPQGYLDFDKGAAKKLVASTHEGHRLTMEPVIPFFFFFFFILFYFFRYVIDPHGYVAKHK